MCARKSLYTYTNSDNEGNINSDDEDTDDKLKTNIECTRNQPKSINNAAQKEVSNVNIANIVIGYSYFLLYVLLPSAVVLLSGISYELIQRNVNNIQKNNVYDNLYDHISLKKGQFPSQDSSIWGSIFAGLVRLNDDPVKPAVYLLMFEKDAMTSSSCIVEIITTSANKYFLNNDRWLLLNGSSMSELKDQEPGVLIETLSQQMTEHSKVIIVTDVQKIPAKLAQGFHFLVDEYNPKFGDAVYIFTLMVPRQTNNSTAVEIVEEILSASWGELDNDVKQALITRVTNVVLPISKENTIESCPLKISSTIEVNIPGA